ncbi:MAG: PhoH family protein, partial [Nevskia sp.]|nr:PhoH family protein [Nevskia sp.]
MKKKIFVLDTNVLMHDPSALFRFEEHDLFIPMVVLEELDAAKKGTSEVSRNARQVSRFLDDLMSGKDHAQIEKGLPLPAAHSNKGNGGNGGNGHANGNGNGHTAPASGRLFFQTKPPMASLPDVMPGNKPDNSILLTALSLRTEHPNRPVTLVSKDINLRIKAAIVGVHAEDYFSDRTIDDVDVLYTGTQTLPADFWERHGKDMRSWKDEDSTWYQVSGPASASWWPNLFVY